MKTPLHPKQNGLHHFFGCALLLSMQTWQSLRCYAEAGTQNIVEVLIDRLALCEAAECLAMTSPYYFTALHFSLFRSLSRGVAGYLMHKHGIFAV